MSANERHGTPQLLRTLASAVLAAALLAPTARAGGGESTGPAAPLSPAQQNTAFVAAARSVFEPMRPSLEALGEWCGTASLFLRRSRIAEALLAFDPECERARAWLRYKRQKDGTWKQTSTRPFSDDNPNAQAEWETRRAAVGTPIREALLPLLEDTKWETAGGRTLVLRALIAMDPDDAELRDRAGEKLVAKRWILAESAATADGRRKLRESVRKAILSASAAKATHPADPGWTSTSKLDLVTVRANVSALETDEIAVRSAQAITLSRLVLGEEMKPPAGLEILVLASHDEFPAFLARRAARSTADRDYLTKQGGVDYLGKMGGSWVSRNEYVCAMYSAPHRVDSVVREVLASMRGPFGYVHNTPPWLSEGMGIYLTHLLVETRLTTLHEKSAYSNQDDLRALEDSGADWTGILRGMIGKGFDPKLPAVLTSPLNSLTKEDGLVAYVLAAYFLEGRVGDLKAFAVRMHGGAGVHQALAEVCGVDAGGLEDRFVRWLRETAK